MGGFTPAILPVDSSLFVAEESLDVAEEVPSASGPVRMSVPFADAIASSKGTLERPRKGMLKEKRLAEGFKEDRVWTVSFDGGARGEIDSNEGRAGGNFDACSSINGGV